MKNKIFILIALLLYCCNANNVYSQTTQCSTPVVGCASTDLSNYGLNSTTNASTLEYDNFVSSFHQTAIRTNDGSFQIWGQNMGNLVTPDVLSPLTINSTNYPALTGTVLKIALGSSSKYYPVGAIATTAPTVNPQAIILTTTGLFVVGECTTVHKTSIFPGTGILI